MEFTILKITEAPSRNGGKFYWIFFKGEDGTSCKTMVNPAYGNFRRWSPIMKVGNVVNGLVFKGKALVDADSQVRLVREAPAEDVAA